MVGLQWVSSTIERNYIIRLRVKRYETHNLSIMQKEDQYQGRRVSEKGELCDLNGAIIQVQATAKLHADEESCT